MKIVSTYSHKDGQTFITQARAREFDEVRQAIEQCDAVACLCKISDERTKPPLLFSPVAMNMGIKTFLHPLGWTETNHGSKKGFREPRIKLGSREFREMDGIKNKVGLEIQFGKYAFMGYDIFTKMPIYAKRGLIDCGIEVVVMHSMLGDMSTGVSSFEQIVLDMENRGVADLDLPTVVVGIAPTDAEMAACQQKRLRFKTDRDKMLASGEVSRGFKGSKPGPKGSDFNYVDEGDPAESGEET